MFSWFSEGHDFPPFLAPVFRSFYFCKCYISTAMTNSFASQKYATSSLSSYLLRFRKVDIISRLRIQQQTVSININFKRRDLYSPGPVIEFCKMFDSRESFRFMLLYSPMTSRKVLMQTTKSPTGPKIHNFQNSWKTPWCSISYVGSKFKCVQLIYRWKGNFIRINISLRTRVQKWTYFELLIENRKDMFLKLVAFWLEIVKIWKSDLKISEQLFN